MAPAWLRLDGEGSLQRQTYRALRGAILDGRIAPGARLDSSRSGAVIVPSQGIPAQT